MTTIGWIQILLYCAIIVAITPALGAYMTRVFNGERTFLSPVLRPVEARALLGSPGSTRSANRTGSPIRLACCCSMSAAFSFSTG